MKSVKHVVNMPQYLICANLTRMRNSLRSCQEPKVKLSYEKGIVFITKMKKRRKINVGYITETKEAKAGALQV